MVVLICFQPLSYHRIAVIMGLIIGRDLLAEEVMGTYGLTAHSFVAIQLFLGIIVFTPGIQLNIYVCLVNLCNFGTLGTFKCSWLATDADN